MASPKKVRKTGVPSNIFGGKKEPEFFEHIETRYYE
jgi:hypothetical protein